MKLSTKTGLELTTTSKELLAAISRVNVLSQSIDCMDTDRQMLLTCVKNGGEREAYVMGITPDSFAMQRVPGEVAALGSFAFDEKTINGLLKGRAEISISVDANLIHVKAVAGKYVAKTELIEIDGIVVKRVERETEQQKTKKVKPEVIEAIRTGVRKAALTNFYSEDPILAFITVGKENVRVDCSDNFHIASYVHAVESGRKLRMAMPVKAFGLIDRFIEDHEVEFSTDETRLRVEGDGFIVVMPATQVDPAMYTIVPNYLKGLTKPISQFALNAEAMKITDNIMAILTEDTKMSMKVDKKTVKLDMMTRNGSVSDAFTAKIKGDPHVAHIDPKIFHDLIKNVSSSNVPFAFFDGGAGTTGCFRMTSEPSTAATLVQIGTFYSD